MYFVNNVHKNIFQAYLKQFEQKLPEIGCASLARFTFKWYSIRSNLGCSMFLFLEFKRVLIRGKGSRMIRWLLTSLASYTKKKLKK